MLGLKDLLGEGCSLCFDAEGGHLERFRYELCCISIGRGCYSPSMRQAGVTVHVVDQVAEVVVLGGPFQTNAAAYIRSHLRHASEDMFHSHPH